MEERIEELLSQMTLEEKVSMLAGADSWWTVPIPRLGIPAIKTTDGPFGARGEDLPSAPTSACLPGGAALGATWNPELVEQIGQALAAEVKSKGAHILLAPTVNIHRSPIAGRDFECISEDPYLTAKIASAYIRGLQSRGVGACIKHFCCNDSEFERQSISSEVGERPLREIYLRPFELALREAKPWSLMSAYNRVNGVFCSENDILLRDILKGEWGFDGLVISDWYGTYSPRVPNGALDLEMPGPARWMAFALKQVRSGEVSEAVVDDKVRRVLRTIERVGGFDQPGRRPETALDDADQRRLAREVAGEAIVLLRNQDAVLPLKPDVKSIAVIGEFAKWPPVVGGGSARVWPHYVVSPLEAICQRVRGARVEYALGTPIAKNPPLLPADWFDGAWTIDYFGNRELSGGPVHSDTTHKPEYVWFGDRIPFVEPNNYSVRVRGAFRVPESGRYLLDLQATGRGRLAIDGETIVDMWDRRAEPLRNKRAAEMELEAGHRYSLLMEFAVEPGPRWRNLRLGCMPVPPADPIAEAVSLAARSDVALVFAGLGPDWESEGFDRPNMDLPGAQDELIERVAAANPNTIVVLSAGSPVTMNWAGQVKSILQAWYLGQETGHAIADVLFGDVNPSGKLPTTFPERLEDTPAFINYPGENGKVVYGEGLYVGYRYYAKKRIEPRFPFGFGLSYTTFAYRRLEIEAGETVRVSLDVENTGSVAGKEVVQVYVHDVDSRLVRAPKELKAFAKVALEPGETKTVTLTLDADSLAYWDPARKGWTAESGEFLVLVGASSRDIRLQGTFTYKAPGKGSLARLNIRTPLGQLLKDRAAMEILEKHLAPFMHAKEIQNLLYQSLADLAPHAPDMLTPERLATIDQELRNV